MKRLKVVFVGILLTLKSTEKTVDDFLECFKSGEDIFQGCAEGQVCFMLLVQVDFGRR